MKKKFEQLKKDFSQALIGVNDRQSLENVRTNFLGRKGQMANLMKEMAVLSKDEKKEAGLAANQTKKILDKLFEEKLSEISVIEESLRAEKEWMDLSLPGDWPAEGHLHPTTQAISEVEDIFAGIGFSRVRAPDIDWDWYAFEALNIPSDHPAHDDVETFFIAETEKQAGSGKKGRIVLTPHTSNAQVREMEKGKLPIRIINIGRTYRRQADISHIPMFHQFEGLAIDKGLTVANLKGVLEHFAHVYFGANRQIRLRPHHFRFTEPSFEIDISCDVCQAGKKAGCRLCKAGWLELGGAGMVHPNVLKAGGIDPAEYSGFAFGWGVERTLMMREGIKIDDIRILYKGDLRFVRQF